VELRRTYAGSAVPKGLLVLLAVGATVALAGAAGVVTRSLSGSGASTHTQVHAAPGTVLRQDNPVQQPGGLLDRGADRGQSSAVTHGARTTGNQVVGDDAVASNGPDSDLTRVLPTKPAAYDPGWDARSVREGHGP
jgi:hypothetical protein